MKSKPRVMIVDDNSGVLRMMRVVLARFYEVHTFDNPETALEFAKGTTLDVAVLDVMMPIRDGFWLFQHLREIPLHIPIIFNSAYQGLRAPEDISHIVRPFAYLDKDGNLETLLSVIQQAVAAGGTQAASMSA